MLDTVRTILIVLEVLFSVALIVVVLLQSGKESGLSGAISGSNTDTYMGKSKSSSLDKKLASSTKWIALVWILLTLALNVVK
ncbi:MAG: preprotein translocase subunit SecG [Oscillospiraceae bacterium]|nr:preprotein translocase subunit SecG [Oscillospiraceae bacterium]